MSLTPNSESEKLISCLAGEVSTAAAAADLGDTSVSRDRHHRRATRPASPALSTQLYFRQKGSPHSITERRLPELIPVLDSQPAGDVSHKPGGRLPSLSAKPAVTAATLKRAATNFAAW